MIRDIRYLPDHIYSESKIRERLAAFLQTKRKTMAKRNLTKYNKEYYERKKEKRKEQVAIRQRAIRDLVHNYKVVKGCSVCGYNKSAWALQFHHLDQTIKSYDIAKMTRRGMSIESIMKEIAKCVVICANCHAETHHNKYAGIV